MDFKLRLRQLFTWNGDIGRAEFLVWGLILFAIKYNLDRLVARGFGKNWFIIRYLIFPKEWTFELFPLGDTDLFFVLLLISVPFIWSGTVLCVKRLRNAELPGWLVLLFFLPFINLILFVVLSVIPERTPVEATKDSYIGKLIPKSKWGSAIFAVGLVSITSSIISLLLIHFLENYGWSLFVGIPFFLGFGSVLLYGFHNRMKYKDAIGVAMASTLFFSLILFTLALEGAICLIMAAPIGFAIAYIGATVGYSIHSSQQRGAIHAFFPLVLLIPATGVLEERTSSLAPTISVETTILIDAPKQVVWDQLVAFSKIEEEPELLFQAGIAYPTHAEIEGRGVGAIRKCNFTTGTFVEPITIWDEPNVLAFGVIDQPPPMIELSIYDNLDIPHLDGYFRSEKGRFDLQALDGNRTLLRGTTWYHHDIFPSIYWKQWSDFILHRIHTRVLVHIKNEAEKK